MVAEKPYRVVAYYKYVLIDNPEEFSAEHLEFCKRIGVRGRIYVANEGINGQFSGTTAQCNEYISSLTSKEGFDGIDFKIDESETMAFKKIHVRHKREIVHSGLDKFGINPAIKTGKHLNADEFLELKDKEEVVLVDVRSKYETNVGKFKGAISFDIETFREFPEKVKELEPYKNKKIITYCTGGIKCEKASAFLLEQGFEDVAQLHGGIIRYAKETGGKDFDGKLYVFDARIVIDINEVNPTIISTCKHCGTSSARMVNCANPLCNDQFVLCEDCGWEHKGCCSDECKESPVVREYNGTGYYTKPGFTM
jgi:UPF0176 protein